MLFLDEGSRELIALQRDIDAAMVENRLIQEDIARYMSVHRWEACEL